MALGTGNKPMGVQRRDAAESRGRPGRSPPRKGDAGRERRVLAIRDRVLPLVRSKGQKHQYGSAGLAGPCHLTTWEDGPFRFVLREPYRPLTRAGLSHDGLSHDGLSHDAPDTWATPPRGAGPAPPPFGFDVWRGEEMVLSLAWGTDGPVVVVALRPGAWEAEALALA